MHHTNLEPFTLDNHDGVPTTIPVLDGWTLVYWYPKADTPGCIAQAESLRDNYEAFEELGCTIYGASFDAPARNGAFRDKYRLPFTLLSDPEGVVARTQGAAGEGDDVARRVAFLVAPDRTIALEYNVTDPAMFAEAVLDDLESAIAKRTNDQ